MVASSTKRRREPDELRFISFWKCSLTFFFVSCVANYPLSCPATHQLHESSDKLRQANNTLAIVFCYSKHFQGRDGPRKRGRGRSLWWKESLRNSQKVWGVSWWRGSDKHSYRTTQDNSPDHFCKPTLSPTGEIKLRKGHHSPLFKGSLEMIGFSLKWVHPTIYSPKTQTYKNRSGLPAIFSVDFLFSMGDTGHTHTGVLG